MNANTKKTTVSLDGFHLLDVSVNEDSRTVVAELSACGEEPEFIYAEQFDAPCNYLRAAIKKAIVYIGADCDNCVSEPKRRSRNDWLKEYGTNVIM